MTKAGKKQAEEQVARFADMFSAIGTEPRLRIMRLLLSAHPDGMVVSDVGNELDIPASTLSHHLDKLKNEDLVKVRREGTFLWYSANTAALQDLLGFLYAECCTRNQAIEPQAIIRLCQIGERMSVATNLKEIVQDKYGEAARRAASGEGGGCCDPISANLYGEAEVGTGAGGSHARVPRLRESDRAGATESR